MMSNELEKVSEEEALAEEKVASSVGAVSVNQTETDNKEEPSKKKKESDKEKRKINPKYIKKRTIKFWFYKRETESFDVSAFFRIQLKKTAFGRYLYRFYKKKIKKDNIIGFAAESAYFILLSFIPFILCVVSILGVLPISTDLLEKGIEEFFPKMMSDFILSIVEETMEDSVGLISISAFIAIGSAAKGMHYLQDGLNKLNNIKDTRSWLTVRFWSILYTIVLIFVILAVMVLYIFGSTLEYYLEIYFPIMGEVTIALLKGKVLYGIIGLTLIFALIYRALPDTKKDKDINYFNQIPGAAICAASWYVISWGMGLYVDMFGGFSMYGSVTTIVLIMFWLQFCMYMFMFGAAFNSYFSKDLTRRIKSFFRKELKAKNKEE